MIIGCDLHTRHQQIARLDSESGEVVEYRLEHELSPPRVAAAVGSTAAIAGEAGRSGGATNPKSVHGILYGRDLLIGHFCLEKLFFCLLYLPLRRCFHAGRFNRSSGTPSTSH